MKSSLVAIAFAAAVTAAPIEERHLPLPTFPFPLPTISIPAFPLPTISIPGFTLPSFSLPGFPLPTLALPRAPLATTVAPIEKRHLPQPTFPFPLPTISIPGFPLPTISIPGFPLPTISIPPLPLTLRDAPLATPTAPIREREVVDGAGLTGLPLPTFPFPLPTISIPGFPLPTISIPLLPLTLRDAPLATPAARIEERHVSAHSGAPNPPLSTATIGYSECKGATLVFARGTGELGKLGSIVGPSLSLFLSSNLDGDLTTIGVDYSASAVGDSNSGADGGPTMAKDASNALTSCPDTKIILAGYSQGAAVVHNALSGGDLDGSKVAAVAVFGDPLQGQTFKGVDSSKVITYCGEADAICNAGGSDSSAAHFSYGSDTSAAAQKIAALVG